MSDSLPFSDPPVRHPDEPAAAPASSDAMQMDAIVLDGVRFALYTAGHGRPTVVMDSGGGEGRASWHSVVPDIAAFTQVVTFDRAGVGQSARSPLPRTGAQIVHELHALLRHAGTAPPFVLVTCPSSE